MVRGGGAGQPGDRPGAPSCVCCLCAGVSMNTQPMYLGESAPKELRGAAAMSSAVFASLGVMMGQVVGLR